ncbi:MAG: isoaspartyl peptidase/L-asparaginase [Bacteroidetes bacterium]|nr:MAG: isoaspartyl peptidase/L-asparaginase [Bacteroidota bacterium]
MKTLHTILAVGLFFSPLWREGIGNEASAQTKPMENFAIVIHGGAGTILKDSMSPALEQQYKDKLNEALKSGYNILAKGGTSMDAVVAAIKVMEDSPLFNAGKGAVFANDGTNSMDASIMDGKTIKAGAVAGVHTIRNPIEGARAVMEKSKHVMLSGDGADKFAKEQGLKIEDPKYFFDEKRWKQFHEIKKKDEIKLDHSSDTSGSINPLDVEFLGDGSIPLTTGDKFGTVGCVALDKYGNLAAGTSTGGMTNKKWDRVGDSPIIGAGTYANNKTCGVSCTGHGEYFIRNVVAYDVAALMEYKELSVEQAANEVIMKKLKAQGAEGGLIAMDAKGNITMPFNTPGMYRGYTKQDGKTWIGIYGSDK